MGLADNNSDGIEGIIRLYVNLDFKGIKSIFVRALKRLHEF